MNSSARSTFSFSLMLLFGCLVLLQMSMFIVHQIWNVQWTWNIFQYCLKAIGEASTGHIIVKFLFNLLIAYTISRMMWRLLNQLYLTWKWNRHFQSKVNVRLTRQLNRKYRAWKIRILVVEDEAFVAISMGIFKPRIVVSAGLFNTFSKREIEAILLHERYHCNHFDPMKAFLFAVVVDGIGYVPIFKVAAHYYKMYKELLADRFAIKHMGTEYYVGAVLFRLSAINRVRRLPVGVPFADVAINYRIMQVLDSQKPIRVPFLKIKPLMFSLAIVLIMMNIVAGGCS